MPRTLNYLSPSGIKLWRESKNEFYLRYLSPEPVPNHPPNKAMSIGSAFDARAKSHIHKVLGGNDPRFEFDAIFEEQVAPGMRDWALPQSEYLFSQYCSSGAMEDIVGLLEKADGVRMEFDLTGDVYAERDGLKSVRFRGKPDLAFVYNETVITLDWKVTGYCSATAQSPRPGYLRLLSAGKTDHGCHRNCVPITYEGFTVNSDRNIERCDAAWAAQIAIYGFLMGSPVGAPAVACIDQLVCGPTPGLPRVRVAQHRAMVGEEFQDQIFDEALEIWEICESGWIFRDLSPEDSKARCEVLDGRVPDEFDYPRTNRIAWDPGLVFGR